MKRRTDIQEVENVSTSQAFCTEYPAIAPDESLQKVWDTKEYQTRMDRFKKSRYIKESRSTLRGERIFALGNGMSQKGVSNGATLLSQTHMSTANSELGNLTRLRYVNDGNTPIRKCSGRPQRRFSDEGNRLYMGRETIVGEDKIKPLHSASPVGRSFLLNDDHSLYLDRKARDKMRQPETVQNESYTTKPCTIDELESTTPANLTFSNMVRAKLLNGCDGHLGIDMECYENPIEFEARESHSDLLDDDSENPVELVAREVHSGLDTDDNESLVEFEAHEVRSKLQSGGNKPAVEFETQKGLFDVDKECLEKPSEFKAIQVGAERVSFCVNLGNKGHDVDAISCTDSSESLRDNNIMSSGSAQRLSATEQHAKSTIIDINNAVNITMADEAEEIESERRYKDTSFAHTSMTKGTIIQGKEDRYFKVSANTVDDDDPQRYARYDDDEMKGRNVGSLLENASAYSGMSVRGSVTEHTTNADDKILDSALPDEPPADTKNDGYEQLEGTWAEIAGGTKYHHTAQRINYSPGDENRTENNLSRGTLRELPVTGHTHEVQTSRVAMSSLHQKATDRQSSLLHREPFIVVDKKEESEARKKLGESVSTLEQIRECYDSCEGLREPAKVINRNENELAITQINDGGDDENPDRPFESRGDDHIAQEQASVYWPNNPKSKDKSQASAESACVDQDGVQLTGALSGIETMDGQDSHRWGGDGCLLVTRKCSSPPQRCLEQICTKEGMHTDYTKREEIGAVEPVVKREVSDSLSPSSDQPKAKGTLGVIEQTIGVPAAKWEIGDRVQQVSWNENITSDLVGAQSEPSPGDPKVAYLQEQDPEENPPSAGRNFNVIYTPLSPQMKNDFQQENSNASTPYSDNSNLSRCEDRKETPSADKEERSDQTNHLLKDPHEIAESEGLADVSNEVKNNPDGATSRNLSTDSSISIPLMSDSSDVSGAVICRSVNANVGLNNNSPYPTCSYETSTSSESRPQNRSPSGQGVEGECSFHQGGLPASPPPPKLLASSPVQRLAASPMAPQTSYETPSKPKGNVLHSLQTRIEQDSRVRGDYIDYQSIQKGVHEFRRKTFLRNVKKRDGTEEKVVTEQKCEEKERTIITTKQQRTNPKGENTGATNPNVGCILEGSKISVSTKPVSTSKKYKPRVKIKSKLAVTNNQAPLSKDNKCPSKTAPGARHRHKNEDAQQSTRRPHGDPNPKLVRLPLANNPYKTSTPATTRMPNKKKEPTGNNAKTHKPTLENLPFQNRLPSSKDKHRCLDPLTEKKSLGTHKPKPDNLPFQNRRASSNDRQRCLDSLTEKKSLSTDDENVNLSTNCQPVVPAPTDELLFAMSRANRATTPNEETSPKRTELQMSSLLCSWEMSERSPKGEKCPTKASSPPKLEKVGQSTGSSHGRFQSKSSKEEATGSTLCRETRKANAPLKMEEDERRKSRSLPLVSNKGPRTSSKGENDILRQQEVWRHNRKPSDTYYICQNYIESLRRQQISRQRREKRRLQKGRVISRSEDPPKAEMRGSDKPSAENKSTSKSEENPGSYRSIISDAIARARIHADKYKSFFDATFKSKPNPRREKPRKVNRLNKVPEEPPQHPHLPSIPAEQRTRFLVPREPSDVELNSNNSCLDDDIPNKKNEAISYKAKSHRRRPESLPFQNILTSPKVRNRRLGSISEKKPLSFDNKNFNHSTIYQPLVLAPTDELRFTWSRASRGITSSKESSPKDNELQLSSPLCSWEDNEHPPKTEKRPTKESPLPKLERFPRAGLSTGFSRGQLRPISSKGETRNSILSREVRKATMPLKMEEAERRKGRSLPPIPNKTPLVSSKEGTDILQQQEVWKHSRKPSDVYYICQNIESLRRQQISRQQCEKRRLQKSRGISRSEDPPKAEVRGSDQPSAEDKSKTEPEEKPRSYRSLISDAIARARSRADKYACIFDTSFEPKSRHGCVNAPKVIQLQKDPEDPENPFHLPSIPTEQRTGFLVSRKPTDVELNSNNSCLDNDVDAVDARERQVTEAESKSMYSSFLQDDFKSCISISKSSTNVHSTQSTKGYNDQKNQGLCKRKSKIPVLIKKGFVRDTIGKDLSFCTVNFENLPKTSPRIEKVGGDSNNPGERRGYVPLQDNETVDGQERGARVSHPGLQPLLSRCQLLGDSTVSEKCQEEWNSHTENPILSPPLTGFHPAARSFERPDNDECEFGVDDRKGGKVKGIITSDDMDTRLRNWGFSDREQNMAILSTDVRSYGDETTQQEMYVDQECLEAPHCAHVSDSSQNVSLVPDKVCRSHTSVPASPLLNLTEDDLVPRTCDEGIEGESRLSMNGVDDKPDPSLLAIIHKKVTATLKRYRSSSRSRSVSQSPLEEDRNESRCQQMFASPSQSGVFNESVLPDLDLGRASTEGRSLSCDDETQAQPPATNLSQSGKSRSPIARNATYAPPSNPIRRKPKTFDDWPRPKKSDFSPEFSNRPGPRGFIRQGFHLSSSGSSKGPCGAETHALQNSSSSPHLHPTVLNKTENCSDNAQCLHDNDGAVSQVVGDAEKDTSLVEETREGVQHGSRSRELISASELSGDNDGKYSSVSIGDSDDHIANMADEEKAVVKYRVRVDRHENMRVRFKKGSLTLCLEPPVWDFFPRREPVSSRTGCQSSSVASTPSRDKGSDSRCSENKGSEFKTSENKGCESRCSRNKGSDLKCSWHKGGDSRCYENKGSDLSWSESKGSDYRDSGDKKSDSKRSERNDFECSEDKGSDSRCCEDKGNDSRCSIIEDDNDRYYYFGRHSGTVDQEQRDMNRWGGGSDLQPSAAAEDDAKSDRDDDLGHQYNNSEETAAYGDFQTTLENGVDSQRQVKGKGKPHSRNGNGKTKPTTEAVSPALPPLSKRQLGRPHRIKVKRHY